MEVSIFVKKKKKVDCADLEVMGHKKEKLMSESFWKMLPLELS